MKALIQLLPIEAFWSLGLMIVGLAVIAMVGGLPQFGERFDPLRIAIAYAGAGILAFGWGRLSAETKTVYRYWQTLFAPEALLISLRRSRSKFNK